MSPHAALHAPAYRRVARAKPGSAPRSVGFGLLALTTALAAATAIGPVGFDLVDTPLSAAARDEQVGLELVSAALVAPWSLIAAVLVLRGRRFGGVLALAPAAYAAYVSAQYLAGTPSTTYGPQHLLHLGTAVLAGWVLVESVVAVGDAVPVPHGRQARTWALAVLGMAAFVVLRWASALAGMATGSDLPTAAAADPGMHWTVLLLDLAVVVPCSVAVARGLWVERPWAATGLHVVVGWYALVPPAVLAMAVVKQLDADPSASAVDSSVAAVATVVFLAVAATLYLPLRRR